MSSFISLSFFHHPAVEKNKYKVEHVVLFKISTNKTTCALLLSAFYYSKFYAEIKPAILNRCSAKWVV